MILSEAWYTRKAFSNHTKWCFKFLKSNSNLHPDVTVGPSSTPRSHFGNSQLVSFPNLFPRTFPFSPPTLKGKALGTRLQLATI